MDQNNLQAAAPSKRLLSHDTHQQITWDVMRVEWVMSNESVSE